MRNPFKTHTVKDPVCGMDVIPGRTAYHARHDGKEYHFCSSECKQTFGLFPGRFTALSKSMEAEAPENGIVRDENLPAPKAACCRVDGHGGGCH
jgi:YHS domain-containing protein